MEKSFNTYTRKERISLKKALDEASAFFMELLVGLEPTACALRMRCSTN